MNDNNIFRRSFLIGGGTLLASLARPGVADDCMQDPPGPTGQDVEGPFFREGAPERTVLHRGGETEVLTVHGTVSGGDAESGFVRIPRARIEIWHASPSGLYDNDTDAYLYRGHFFTDARGRYSFDTATPAGYRDGPFDRPAHIHYKVSAEGWAPLTTQLYFDGDRKLGQDVFVNRNDGYARTVALERLAPGQFRTRFDLRLEAAG